MREVNLFHLVVVVFIISWIGVLPGLLIAYGIAIPDALKSLEILMTLGPILGAIIFLWKGSGVKGLKQFFSRLLYFKVPAYVFILAIGIPLTITFLSAWIGSSIFDSTWPESFTFQNILVNGLLIFLMYLFLNTEELVWRGIVFDQLLDKHGFLRSCLLLIPIWGIFHLPLFLYPGGHQAGYGILEFTCIVIAQTFILGWIYVRTGRSLFYVHIHHQLINGFGQAFPIFPIFINGNKYPIWVLCTLLLVTAFILYGSYRRGRGA